MRTVWPSIVDIKVTRGSHCLCAKAGSSAISRAVGMGVSHCVLNMNRVIGMCEIKAGTVVASSVAPKAATWADDLLQEISF